MLQFLDNFINQFLDFTDAMLAGIVLCALAQIHTKWFEAKFPSFDVF